MTAHPTGPPSLQIPLPNPAATAEAKKAALVNISLALVQFNANNLHAKAQGVFGEVQQRASKILLELLDEYQHAHDAHEVPLLVPND